MSALPVWAVDYCHILLLPHTHVCFTCNCGCGSFSVSSVTLLVCWWEASLKYSKGLCGKNPSDHDFPCVIKSSSCSPPLCFPPTDMTRGGKLLPPRWADNNWPPARAVLSLWWQGRCCLFDINTQYYVDLGSRPAILSPDFWVPVLSVGSLHFSSPHSNLFTPEIEMNKVFPAKEQRENCIFALAETFRRSRTLCSHGLSLSRH